MIRPMAVEPREGYRIWLRYSDGTAGEIDLAHLAGRGVFTDWHDRTYFETVHLAPAGGDRLGRRRRTVPGRALLATHRQARDGSDAGGPASGRPCLNSAGSTESASGCILTITG